MQRLVSGHAEALRHAFIDEPMWRLLGQRADGKSVGFAEGSMHGRHFATRLAAMDEVIDSLGFYNARRLHSTLDQVSPMTFVKNWLAAQQSQLASLVMRFVKQRQGLISADALRFKLR